MEHGNTIADQQDSLLQTELLDPETLNQCQPLKKVGITDPIQRQQPKGRQDSNIWNKWSYRYVNETLSRGQTLNLKPIDIASVEYPSPLLLNEIN